MKHEFKVGQRYEDFLDVGIFTVVDISNDTISITYDGEDEVVEYPLLYLEQDEHIKPIENEKN